MASTEVVRHFVNKKLLLMPFPLKGIDVKRSFLNGSQKLVIPLSILIVHYFFLQIKLPRQPSDINLQSTLTSLKILSNSLLSQDEHP
jgi:hypothetical protein